tara:strand:- start:35 stop:769 length:735 start_codon:yes stop_codon:yes gene_type:complete
MISIDTVYQRVLALANKEQRGYITPLEYNLHANQAQQLIFEQYFYDLDQVKKTDTDISSFSDMEELIGNKLAPFTENTTLTNPNVFPRDPATQVGTPPSFGEPDYYRTGRVYVLGYEARKVSSAEFTNIKESRFHSYGLAKSPIYRTSTEFQQDIEVWNGATPESGEVTVELIRKPEKVEWGYDVINEKALYNASRSINYQLHESEETELVYKILALAGITINKSDLSQVALALDNVNTSQQKQ